MIRQLTSRHSRALHAPYKRQSRSCKSWLLIEIILRSRYMFYHENYIVLSILPKNWKLHACGLQNMGTVQQEVLRSWYKVHKDHILFMSLTQRHHGCLHLLKAFKMNRNRLRGLNHLLRFKITVYVKKAFNSGNLWFLEGCNVFCSPDMHASARQKKG